MTGLLIFAVAAFLASILLPTAMRYATTPERRDRVFRLVQIWAALGVVVFALASVSAQQAFQQAQLGW